MRSGSENGFDETGLVCMRLIMCFVLQMCSGSENGFDETGLVCMRLMMCVYYFAHAQRLREWF